MTEPESLAPPSDPPPAVVVQGAAPEHRARVLRILDRIGFPVAEDTAGASERPSAALVVVADGALADVGAEVSEATEDPDAPPVVVLSEQADARTLEVALEAGAVGFLPVDTDPAALDRALRGVTKGELAVPRSMLPDVIARLRRDHVDRVRRNRLVAAGLAGREQEVLGLLSAGRSTNEIAAELFVSPATVRTHVAAVVRKLGAESRSDAIRRFAAP